jgi:prolyl-tRNA editing enzyme YbaK/EbsC (Cys-tRNA(Pro) deacylase)
MEGTYILPNLLAFNNNRVPNTLIVRDSPNNNSLLNAITEMNTRLHNKRMEKVKENRMKIRSTGKILNK